MQRFTWFLSLLLFVCLTDFPGLGYAQSMGGIDPATVNVDNLSDQQLTQLLQKAQENGLTVDEVVQQAQAKGMPVDQANKLRDRLNGLQNGDTTKLSSNTINSQYGRRYLFSSRQDSLKEIQSQNDEEFRKRIFGADLFSNANLTFEPNLNIPTPANYVIGPGDELIINVYGYSEKSDKVKVEPEGYIRLSSIAPILVSGLTISEARTVIASKLSSIYSGIKTGSTQVQVMLGDIRSIRVMLIGEVARPGSYTLPSLATVANALYVSGGPSINGSFRDIEVIRDGKAVVTFDLYDFLTHGDLSNNILLHDQDVIKVSAYKSRVELTGQVKHPAIFESKDGETLGMLINYAGGFTAKAYKDVISASRVTDKEKTIVTLRDSVIDRFVVRGGDVFYVDSILDRYTNRVIIAGSVLHPGIYALTPDMTVKDLIGEADGLKENAFTSLGLIKRYEYDFAPSMIGFDVQDVMSGAKVIPLEREDSVFLYSKFDVREPYSVVVQGEVNHPDTIAFADSMKLQDAILMAGGFKDAATVKFIEVGRRIRSQGDFSSDTIAVIGRFEVNRDLSDEAAGYVLQPFDIITVRRSPSYANQGIVKIEGQVLYPGAYVIDRKSEKLSDVIKKAGGLIPDAFASGSLLLRKPVESRNTQELAGLEQNKLNVFAEANRGNDSTELSKVKNNLNGRLQLVGINLDRALTAPGSKYDLLVEDSDVIRVPKKLETVSLFGEIFFPKQVRFDNRYRFKDFIAQGGGFTVDALKRRSYVVYPNGEVQSTRKVLFFNHFPKVKPGSEIFVPSKPQRTPVSAQEIIGMASGLVAIIGILIAVLK